MIYGILNQSDNFAFLLCQPAWSSAFDWLVRNSASPEVGKYPIWGDELFAVVMRYDTVDPNESRYESHRKYVDLQYTIDGGEWIAWSPIHTLETDGEYDNSLDLQFYETAEPSSKVLMSAGRFSIYYPSDAHLPKLNDGVHKFVYKAVVKVGRHLIV